MLNLYRSSGEVVLNGIAGCRTARGNAQFAVDGAEVGMHGAGAEHQLFGYLGVGEALRHQAQHLYLACGQPSGVGLSPLAASACFGVMARPWPQAAVNAFSPRCTRAEAPARS